MLIIAYLSTPNPSPKSSNNAQPRVSVSKAYYHLRSLGHDSQPKRLHLTRVSQKASSELLPFSAPGVSWPQLALPPKHSIQPRILISSRPSLPSHSQPNQPNQPNRNPRRLLPSNPIRLCEAHLSQTPTRPCITYSI